jgi:hypothetical protein
MRSHPRPRRLTTVLAQDTTWGLTINTHTYKASHKYPSSASTPYSRCYRRCSSPRRWCLATRAPLDLSPNSKACMIVKPNAAAMIHSCPPELGIRSSSQSRVWWGGWESLRFRRGPSPRTLHEAIARVRDRHQERRVRMMLPSLKPVVGKLLAVLAGC